MPFFSRLIFAWIAYFRILFDGELAAKLAAVASGAPALPEAPTKEEPKLAAPSAPSAPPPAPPKPSVPPPPPTDAALQLLSMFQREGRFIDFLEEDVASFSDGDIGAAARVVHQGCRKALREHFTLEPVRKEEEGVKVTIPSANPNEIKLTGNVAGTGPYTGTIRHKGWRATEVKLPQAVAGHDPRVVAQAEVEL